MARARIKHAVRENSPLFAERIFVDTSAWCALTNVDDQYHEAAVKFLEAQDPGLLYVTSLSVVAEFLSILRARKGAEASEQARKSIMEHPRHLVEMHLREDLEQASLLFEKAPRHASFVDCLSAATAQRLKIFDVFAFDTWFRAQGLRVVPG